MKITERILALLYPRKCPFCRRLIDEDRRICKSCDNKLPRLSPQQQGRRLGSVDACCSVFHYEGSVRESLHRYKFGSLTAYAEIYGSFLAKCIDENQISCDIITWVPLSRRRLRSRGYDQARLLADCAAAHLGLECTALLVKMRDNPAQSGTKSAAERKKNVAGVYALKDGVSVKGRHVLIIDDIVTTGSTLSECARVLKNEGAARVTALTVAAGIL